MGVLEYGYQRADHKDVRKLVIWLQNRLNLRDWTVYLYTDPQPPKKVNGDSDKMSVSGGANINSDRRRAWVWVSPEKCKLINENPFEAVCHEVCHILAEAVSVGESCEEELLIRTISPLLYQLYCRETGRKIAQLVEGDD